MNPTSKLQMLESFLRRNEPCFNRSSIRSEVSVNLSGGASTASALIAPPEAFQDLENPDESFSSSRSNDNHSSLGDSGSLNRSTYAEFQFSKFAITYFQVSRQLRFSFFCYF